MEESDILGRNIPLKINCKEKYSADSSTVVLSSADSTYSDVDFRQEQHTKDFDETYLCDYGREDADDIFMRKYAAEKKKYRLASAANSKMKTMIETLNKNLQDKTEEARNQKEFFETHMEKNNEKILFLEKSLSDLKMHSIATEKECSEQIHMLHNENELKIEAARREGDRKVAALQAQFTELQYQLQEAREMLEEEKMKNISSVETLITVQKAYDSNKLELEEKLRNSGNAIDRLRDVQESSRRTIEEKNAGNQKLQSIISSLNRKLMESGETCLEYRLAMKDISIDYISAVEKLENFLTMSSKQAQKLDSLENSLKNEMVEKAVVKRQLEGISRDYVIIHDLLEKEKIKSSQLEQHITDISIDLKSEREKSNKLRVDLDLTTVSLERSRLQTAQFKDSNQTLSNDITELKMGLTQAILKVKSLSQNKNDLEEQLENQYRDLNMEREKNVVILSEVNQLRCNNEELKQTLHETDNSLQSTIEAMNNLSKDFKEKTSETNNLFQTLEAERSERDVVIREKDNQIEYLLQHVNRIPMLESELSNIESLSFSLQESLAKKENEYVQLNQQLDKEREEGILALSERDEVIRSLKSDLQSLEHRFEAVFRSLVENENKLQTTKESLDEAKLDLEKSYAERQPVELKLRQDIANLSKQLQLEKQKSIFISNEMDELKEKYENTCSMLQTSNEKVVILENQLSNLERKVLHMDKHCESLASQVENERSNPVKKKLKVAINMIKAEKDRYKALLTQIDDQNDIITRVEDELKRYQKDLKSAKSQLKAEKSEKVIYSSNALQELHHELENERKKMRDEKHGLRAELNEKQKLIQSLNLRLKVFECKDSAEKEFVDELKKRYEMSKELSRLTEENAMLKDTIEKQNKTTESLDTKLSSVENQLNDFQTAMANLTQYCKAIEQEKKDLQKRLESTPRTAKTLSETINMDDEVSECLSLEDFSVAQVPVPRLVYGNYILDRASEL